MEENLTFRMKNIAVIVSRSAKDPDRPRFFGRGKNETLNAMLKWMLLYKYCLKYKKNANNTGYSTLNPLRTGLYFYDRTRAGMVEENGKPNVLFQL